MKSGILINTIEGHFNYCLNDTYINKKEKFLLYQKIGNLTYHWYKYLALIL